MKRRAFLQGLGAAGGLALAPALTTAAPAARGRAVDRLRDAKIQIGSRIRMIARGAVQDHVEVELGAGRSARRADHGATLTLTATPVAGKPDAIDVLSTFKADAPSVDQYNLTLGFNAWSRDNYVVLPGFCYAGNRFQSRRPAYPPLLTEPADIGPHVPPIIPGIHRLSAGPGDSWFAADTVSLATPALGVHVPALHLGIVVLVRSTAAGGGGWFQMKESDDRTRATVTLGGTGSVAPNKAPLVFEGSAKVRPFAPDAAPGARGGQIPARIHVFECADVPALFERIFALRKELTGPTALVHDRPFSALFAAHEARVNGRWVDKPGYLAAGDRSTAYTTWQTGWGGGLATTLPLIAAGSKTSRERAFATTAFALGGGQAPSGFFHGISDGKTWYDDGFVPPVSAPPVAPSAPRTQPVAYKHARRWHLVRRSAETLTLLVKQLALLERHAELRAGAASERWADAARRAADALVKLWERNKQLGQFVDIESGELVVGGSTSAGLAPAGLALAAALLKQPRYLVTAQAMGEHYYERFVRLGLTCGGPGDVLQAPDSQSAAALLDSFMTLFEATRDRVWIDRARATAHLLASWVISYDAPAAGRSCVDSRVRATGAVFWSAGSGRGSPGYVLASGDALLRLYRATGDVALLELLRDTIHNLAQYLPETDARRKPESEDPRCAPADSGRWLDQAVSVVPDDGVFDAIGLLSYTEVPGIYARVDSGFVFVFDHVTARIKERTRGRLVLAVANPTRVDATVRILSETADGAAEPLRPGAVLDAQTAVVPAGATIQVSVPPL
jgi:hypothetical protein